MPRAVGRVKQCAKCREHLGVGEFHKQRARPDGLNPYCKRCANAQTRAHYAKNPAAVKARTAAWAKAHPDVSRAKVAQWRARNPEAVKARKQAEYAADPEGVQRVLRDAAFRRKYGITLAERDEMAAAQNYTCAICGVHESELPRRLAVDHNHDTAAVRELLCGPCNTGLAAFRENPANLRAAMEYLRRHDERTDEEAV